MPVKTTSKRRFRIRRDTRCAIYVFVGGPVLFLLLPVLFGFLGRFFARTPPYYAWDHWNTLKPQSVQFIEIRPVLEFTYVGSSYTVEREFVVKDPDLIAEIMERVKTSAPSYSYYYTDGRLSGSRVIRIDFVLNDGRRIGFNISLDSYRPIASLIEIQDPDPNVYRHRIWIEGGTRHYSKMLYSAVVKACREESIEWVRQDENYWDEKPDMPPVHCPSRPPVDDGCPRTYKKFREKRRILYGK